MTPCRRSLVDIQLRIPGKVRRIINFINSNNNNNNNA